METSQVIDSLAALAQRSRLAVFRLLVESGPEGLAAGVISERLTLPPATLSFHLAHLLRAGLVRSRSEGRFMFYSTEYANIDALVRYLTENCCSAASCRRPARSSPHAKANGRGARTKAAA